MIKQRKTSINVAISILKALMEGKHLSVGNEMIAMNDEGRVGYLLQNDKEKVIVGDISLKYLAGLVEKHEIIPIPEVRK